MADLDVGARSAEEIEKPDISSFLPGIHTFLQAFR